MSSNSCIIPECYVDSCLIEVLLYANRDHVNHQKGNGTVAGQMKKKFANEFCVGIIDEDRKQLDYLTEFDLMIDLNNLKLWRHKSWPQYIVQICPVIESWILSQTDIAGLRLQDYGLPVELIDLKRETKSVDSKNDQRFIRLFKDLLRQRVSSVGQLQNWIRYLRDNKYKADINQLKNG